MSQYKLKLYIISNDMKSRKAEENILSICNEYLDGLCDLEVIDIERHPDKAEEAGILAVPTLIKKEPLPESRLIGALDFKSRVLAGLGIQAK